jgi:hypothetical protein
MSSEVNAEDSAEEVVNEVEQTVTGIGIVLFCTVITLN